MRSTSVISKGHCYRDSWRLQERQKQLSFRPAVSVERLDNIQLMVRLNPPKKKSKNKKQTANFKNYKPHYFRLNNFFDSKEIRRF